jgi:hypothetical protein
VNQFSYRDCVEIAFEDHIYMPMSGEDDYLIVRRCVGCVSEASLENDDITIGIIIRSNVILVAVLWDDIYMGCRMNSLAFVVNP